MTQNQAPAGADLGGETKADRAVVQVAFQGPEQLKLPVGAGVCLRRGPRIFTPTWKQGLAKKSALQKVPFSRELFSVVRKNSGRSI
jgi:hypothetical protein